MEEEITHNFINRKVLIIIAIILLSIVLVCFGLYVFFVKDYIFLRKIYKQGNDNLNILAESENIYIRNYTVYQSDKYSVIKDIYKSKDEYLYISNQDELLKELIYDNYSTGIYNSIEIEDNMIEKYAIIETNKPENNVSISEKTIESLKEKNEELNNITFWYTISQKDKITIEKNDKTYIIRIDNKEYHIDKEKGIIKEYIEYNEKNEILEKSVFNYDISNKTKIYDMYQSIYDQNAQNIIEISKEEYEKMNCLSKIFDINNKDNLTKILLNSSNIIEILERHYDSSKIELLVSNILYDKSNDKSNFDRESTIVFNDRCVELISYCLELFDKEDVSNEEKIVLFVELNKLDYSEVKDENLRNRLSNFGFII